MEFVTGGFQDLLWRLSMLRLFEGGCKSPGTVCISRMRCASATPYRKRRDLFGWPGKRGYAPVSGLVGEQMRRALVFKGEDGEWVAASVSVPGCVNQ